MTYPAGSTHIVELVGRGQRGSDQHPDWFRNIENDEKVTIEVPGASLAAIATLADNAERSDVLRQLAAGLPGMSDHIGATSRDIPVVIFSEANQ